MQNFRFCSPFYGLNRALCSKTITHNNNLGFVWRFCVPIFGLISKTFSNWWVPWWRCWFSFFLALRRWLHLQTRETSFLPSSPFLAPPLLSSARTSFSTASRRHCSKWFHKLLLFICIFLPLSHTTNTSDLFAKSHFLCKLIIHTLISSC